ncbi:response regulator [Candidatus Woesearchaeota archaeon]|nr:response regulator [Candidatus Woesearchaeota archaeon]
MHAILAVDQDIRILEDVKRVLTPLPASVTVAMKGEDAIAFLKTGKFDMLISAIDTGDIDGLQLIQEAKKRFMATMVVSARNDEDTIGMITAYYKPDRYLTKPLNEDVLLHTVQDLLKTGALPAALRESVLNELSAHFPGGIAVLNSECDILWVNEYLESKGFSLRNVYGQKSHFAFEHRHSPQEPTIKALQTGKTHSGTHKGEDQHSYSLTSIPLVVDGKVKYLLEVTLDLSAMSQ